MKRLLAIFGTALTLNLAWEHLHAPLYAGYQGGAITEFILLRASLGDAVIITGGALLFLYVPYFKKHRWLVWPLGLWVAVAIELFALYTGRWAYGPAMPLVFGIGLTPLVQLATTGSATMWLVVWRKR